MAGTSFIPSREADLVTFSTNFNTRIAAAPTTYALTAAQATAYTALHNAWIAAYQAANSPSSNNSLAVTAKNQAKVNLIDGAGGIRQLARIVQAAPAVTAQQKQDLGLTVRDAEPTPIPPPQFSPGLDIVSTAGRVVKIRLHDSQSPTSRARPGGVDGAMVFTFVGDEAPNDLAAWKFYSLTNKLIVDVEFSSTVPNGSKVWFTASWFNPRSESGPACQPISAIMPGGLAQAA